LKEIPMSIAKRRLGIAVSAFALFGMVGLSVVPAYAAATCADQAKVVKAEWDKAPSGPKKNAAEKHYVKAVAAQKKNDEKTCLTELNAAAAALK
jgi:hypothetical protein